MQLVETVKLYLSNYKRSLVTCAMKEYIATVNSLVAMDINGTSIAKITTANVNANLPSALTNQCIRDARSIVKNYRKKCCNVKRINKELEKRKSNIRKSEPTVPVVKRQCCYINSQNFKIKGNRIEFPVRINGKTKRISVITKMTKRQKELLSCAKLGTMRIIKKQDYIMAQLVYEIEEVEMKTEGNVMGVDLGIKCPAVSHCTDGSVKFYGNGRKNKYIRRRYAYLRKKLQKSKKISAVKRINNKEQRIMKDIDHKISHDIVKTAKEHNVRVIKLERLSNIRSTTRTSRKNNHSLHNWSFYRLMQFIEYKAKRVGISVEYVDPAYTSQKCPICGSVHHANDRSYVCECGFHTHRDLLGAMNICRSTEYVGNRHTA